MLAVGILLGAAGGFLITRVLGSLLYGATATHPTTYAAAAAILLLAASLASFLPARQAMNVDPWISLRHE
jgi:ABC-type antimicrobial peptide transport system permease subunit